MLHINGTHSEKYDDPKKMVTAAHLLSNILNDYISDAQKQCPFVENDNENENIFEDLLKHIIISEPIKNHHSVKLLNCTIATNEILELYLTHLKTYHSFHLKTYVCHSIPCDCLFWEYYQNRFIKNEHSLSDFDFEQKELKLEQSNIDRHKFISNSGHLLNCSFFIKIIQNSVVSDKLQTQQISYNKWSVKINKSLTHNNMELYDTEIIFSDYENTTELIKANQFLNFSEIYKLSLSVNMNSTDFKSLLTKKPKSKLDLLSTLSTNSNMGMQYLGGPNNFSLQTLLTPDSDGGGMVYLSDYGDMDEFNFNGLDDREFDNKAAFLNPPIGLKKSASSPVLPHTANLNKSSGDEDETNFAYHLPTMKSVVAYDSNKFYIPHKGYGLMFKTQSEISVNSNLPGTGKISSAEESVLCFDD